MGNTVKRFTRHEFDDDKEVHVKKSGKNHSKKKRRFQTNEDIFDSEEHKYDEEIKYFSSKWR